MSDKSVEFQMKQLMDGVSEKIEKAVDEALKEPPKLTKKLIMKNAPRLSGSYRRGWKIKRHRKVKSAVVYNDTDPGLAHLLEFGHIAKNQRGVYGRVNGIKHIKPAEEEGVDLFIQTINEALDEILE